MAETVSAVLVPVLEAERVVSRHRARLDAAEADVLSLLPVSARVSRVWLMTGGAEPGSWRTVAEFPLAG
jgi:hypothetical protein